MHLNDAKLGLKSRRDRHESIGKGKIGLDGFAAVIRYPATADIPLILETPEPEIWKEEIALLRKMEEG